MHGSRVYNYVHLALHWKAKEKGISLEIPATYTFQHKKPSKVNKVIALLKDKENKTSLQLLTDTLQSKKETSCYLGSFKCLPFLSGRVMIDFIVISGLILRLGC